MEETLKIYRMNNETGEATLEKEFTGDPGQFSAKVFNKRSFLSYPILRAGLADTNPKKDHYVMVYPSKWNELLDENLDTGEIRVLNATIGLITQFHTGILADENGDAITATYLMKRAKIDKSRGFKAINSLVCRGVLYKERKGRGFIYFANPFIFACGKGSEINLVDKFHSTKWAKGTPTQALTYECKV